MYRENQNSKSGLRDHFKIVGLLIALFVWAWCVFSLDVPTDTDAPADIYSISSNVIRPSDQQTIMEPVHSPHSSAQN